jgi:hypothetical protein
LTDCSSLRSISIPSAVETISWKCFVACWQLRTIVLEPGSKLSVQSLSDLRSSWTVVLK